MSFSLVTLITALGWAGAAAGLVAYGMVSKGRWGATSVAFQMTNVGCGIAMLSVAVASGIWPSAASNVAAIVIGGQTLLRVRSERAAARREQELAANASRQELVLAA
jgi:hypothetical protein